MDGDLLNTAKDCFYFVTRFFEPISISAAHIYHSALEQSPLSSTVRKLYYHQRPTPFPRMPVGIPDSWDPSITISRTDSSPQFSTWSPCGQFVAIRTAKVAEVRDRLTFKLLFTLQPAKPTTQLTGILVYSPDGCSIACATHSTMIIWDIQTGGVAREIQLIKPTFNNLSLVWSLDGRIITTVTKPASFQTPGQTRGIFAHTIQRYDVVSGEELSHLTLDSGVVLHLWASSECFWVMTVKSSHVRHTINIFKIGSTLTRTESFIIPSTGHTSRILCFSPTTYHISVQDDRLLILGIRNLEGLLDQPAFFGQKCFSSDGSLFAASCLNNVQIWSYDSGCYIPWRKFHQAPGSDSHFLLSPTASSILSGSWGMLRLQHVDSPLPTSTTQSLQLCIFSHSGTYVALAHHGKGTVTIINCISQAPSQFIETGMVISALALIGNVLLVMDLQIAMAWLLNEEGQVHSVLDRGKVDHSDSIWTVLVPLDAMFLVMGQIGAIKSNGSIHAYNSRTGEVLEPTQVSLLPVELWYSIQDIIQGWKHLYDDSVCNTSLTDSWKPSKIILEEGWIKGHKGKHLLWLPAELASLADKVGWVPNVGMMWFETSHHYPLIIKLY